MKTRGGITLVLAICLSPLTAFQGRAATYSGASVDSTFVILGDPVTVPEGDTGAFTVALAKRPQETVVVTVVFQSGDTDIRVGAGTSLTFDKFNYATPQVVTLDAMEDQDTLNGTATIVISSPGYTSAYVVANESDNDDLPGFLIGGEPVVVREGRTGMFTVALPQDPCGLVDVSVFKTSGDPDITVASGTLLTFSSSNYTIPQTVTLMAAEDLDNLDGTALFSVSALGYTTANVVASELDAAIYGGGIGTPDDPYQIWTPQQMNTVGKNPNDWGQHFELMADIDMSIYTGTQYNIIGNLTTNFTGTFDGNGHVISNLTYEAPAVSYVGMFGYTDDALIENLGLENVNIGGGNFVGGLVGYHNYGGALTGCYVTGSVSGSSCVGGLVGSNFWPLFNCYATASVTGTRDYVGGLIGSNFNWVTSCYATGSVSGRRDVGGLVGELVAGELKFCYATGSVSGIGEESYATGGLVGRNGWEGHYGTIIDCYATGSVNGTINVGGLVGSSDSDYVDACFWDIQTSGLTDGVGDVDPDPNGVTGLDTVTMMTLSTFTSTGWDFTNEILNGTNDYWRMCVDGADYPHLTWEHVKTGDFACPDGMSFDDAARLANDWLMSYAAPLNGADASGDAFVNFLDFAILGSQWLEQ